MWTITSYYNPIGYRRRLANYRLFRANLGVPLVTVELSFDGGFELAEDDSDILIQLSGDAVLWQKERLLNLAVKAVPAGVNNIAWLDCDVILQRADWIDEAKRQLDEFNVVQLFSDAIHLDREDYEKSPRMKMAMPSCRASLCPMPATCWRKGNCRQKKCDLIPGLHGRRIERLLKTTVFTTRRLWEAAIA